MSAAADEAAGVRRAPRGGAWRRRALKLVQRCVKDDVQTVLAAVLKHWPVTAVQQAIEGWPADTLAAVCNEWRPTKVAKVLADQPPRSIVRMCESWEPDFIARVLPRFKKLRIARIVLARLYFRTGDPYLSTYECHCIIMKFKPRRRARLLRKFDQELVQHVLDHDHSSSSEDYSSDEDEDGDRGGGDDGGEGEGEDPGTPSIAGHGQQVQHGEGAGTGAGQSGQESNGGPHDLEDY